MIHDLCSRVEAIFDANRELKAEGYYLAEFEFRMLGIACSLDHGEFRTALSALDDTHRAMTTREGLAKVPAFTNVREKLAFHRSLQNPRTGACHSVDYVPLVSFVGVTAPMVKFIEDLSREAAAAADDVAGGGLKRIPVRARAASRLLRDREEACERAAMRKGMGRAVSRA